MSPELRQYLTEWYEWATGDAVDWQPFCRGLGLCANAPSYVRDELEDLLWADFRTATYPFGDADFSRRCRDDTMHRCPKRLAWVASKIGR